MDDILRMAETIESAQNGNVRMESIMKMKLLEFNQEKSCFIVMGNRKARKKFPKNQKIITLCGEPMLETRALKYLGDFLCSTLEESVHYEYLNV